MIESYGRADDPSDEVIIQEMVVNPSMSGVLFTYDHTNSSPYFVINYDDMSGKTNTVTSGDGQHSNRTLFVSRNGIKHLKSERFLKLMNAVDEIQELLAHQFLDIEFALTKELDVHIFQVRRIASLSAAKSQDVENRSAAVFARLANVYSQISDQMTPKQGLFGDRTVLGQMPDWNPAEMIGQCPRPLARSLYEELITNDAWSIARQRMGYRSPAGFPLMVMLSGHGFINTRLSFNSFLPQGLSDDVCGKLVNCWLQNLAEKPWLHDKVEFDIAITGFRFDFLETVENLCPGILTEVEKRQLQTLFSEQMSNLLDDNHPGSIAHALGQVDKLPGLYDQWNEHGFPSVEEMIAPVREFGTIQFSILARHGFLAQQVIRSLVALGVLSTSRTEEFFRSVKTVATEFTHCMQKLQAGELSMESFHEKFGHLRPGSYDITAPAYCHAEDFFANTHRRGDAPKVDESWTLTKTERQAIEEVLATDECPFASPDQLFDYVEAATRAREYSKFVFSKGLFFILEQIAEFGQRHDITRQELALLEVGMLMQCTGETNEIEMSALRAAIDEARTKYEIDVLVHLPQIIDRPESAYVSPYQVNVPNYITSKTIEAPIVMVDGIADPDLFDGKVAVIEGQTQASIGCFQQILSGLSRNMVV